MSLVRNIETVKSRSNLSVVNSMSEHPRVTNIKKRETDSGVLYFSSVKSNFPNNPRRQIDEFFDNFNINSGTGRARVVSLSTRKTYKERMKTLISKLDQINMRVQNLDELGSKQVKLCFQRFEEEGWSASWISNLNTTVRRFGIWIGKPDLCPQIGKLLKNPERFRRMTSATRIKDWDGLGQEFEDIVLKVDAKDPITGFQLRFARAFGVRVQEILMLRPISALRDDRRSLFISAGTKGGLPRHIPIETDEQRQLIEKAMVYASTNPDGIVTGVPGYTLRQSLNHFYYVLKTCGISNRDNGISAHGLRHGYACRIYKHITGEAAPVMGGNEVPPARDEEARREISKRLGHSRINITNHYLGNYKMLEQVKKSNIEKFIDSVESDTELKEKFRECGLSNLYLLGEHANGHSIEKGKSNVLFGFYADMLDGENQKQADTRSLFLTTEITIRLEGILETPVFLKPMSIVNSQIPRLELSALCSTQGTRK